MRRRTGRRGFSAIIYERRRELRLTQQDVANEIGVHANYIGYLEKGVRKPSNKTLLALCRLLKLDRRRLCLSLRPLFRDIVIGPDEGPCGQPLPPELAELRRDRATRRRHRISDEDIRNMAHLKRFGRVRDKDGFLKFLSVVRDVTDNKAAAGRQAR